MNSYQILVKNRAAIAVNLQDEEASAEIQSLTAQGFKIHPYVIEATCEDKALLIYKAQKATCNSEQPCTFKNIMLFRTNRLKRFPYLGYSLLALLLSIPAGLIIGVGAVTIIFLPIALIIAAPVIWLSIATSVARWKNCGHQAWLYIFPLSATLIIDALLGGVGSLIFWLYLVFRPESENLSHMEHSPESAAPENDTKVAAEQR